VKTAMTWLLAIALLGGAWAVTLLAPSDDAGRDAFVTEVAPGERGVGRNIAATVTDVRAASSITAESGWHAEGHWLVVDLTAEATASQSSGILGAATLRIGDRTFSATERGPDEMTLYRTQLVPGVPQHGSLLFELPDTALHGIGVLRLSTGYGDPWGDSVLEIPIDLDAVEHAGAVTVDDKGWAKP